MDRLPWQQRKKMTAPGLEAQNRWDGILKFIQSSTYAEEAHGDAVGSSDVENGAISASPLQIKGKVEFVNLAVTEEELSASVRNLLSVAARVAEWAEQASNELELAGVIVGAKPALYPASP
jgi:hypothetical protein